MATQNDSSASKSGSGPARSSPRQIVEYEDYIEAQLRKTKSHVRSVDLADSLLTLAVGTLAWFFFAALVDHWVVTGGLGFWSRLTFLAIYLAGAGWYLGARVLPLLFRSINPVYAAQTIERSRPSLKNSLVNFLFFREDHSGLAPVVYEAVEEQAATKLAKENVEAAVDRSHLIKIGYALAALLLVAAIYALLSPKDLFRAVGRVIMPWSELLPATRAAIVDVQPGNAEAFRGQQIEVSCRVQGLPDGAPVTLYYTTADGQTVDRAVSLQLTPGGYKHACVLPEGGNSFEQTLEYRIEAGDAASKRYKVTVSAAPTLVVRAVEYEYPAYTGLVAQRVEHQGDIKAIEGTQVTLDAVANQPIDIAHVDFDCDMKLDQRMQVEKQQARASFKLALKADRRTPLHSSYELIFKNPDGQQNPQPIRHQIEVTPDVAPTVQFVTPKKEQIELPAGSSTELEVAANDPDFALRRVKIAASVGRRQLPETFLLDEVWRGQFVRKHKFDSRTLNLQPGDVVELLAVAEDNKLPQPNRVESEPRRIRIISPQRPVGEGNQLARNSDKASGDGDRLVESPDGKEKGTRPADETSPDNKGQQRSTEKRPSDGSGEQNARGSQGNDKQGQESGEGEKIDAVKESEGGKRNTGDTSRGQQAQKRDEPKPEEQKDIANDGSNDGDAFEQILKHRDEHTPKDQKQDSASKNGQGQQQKQQQQQQGSESGKQSQSGEQSGDQKQNNSAEQNAQDQANQDGKQAGGDQNSQKEQSADAGNQRQSNSGKSNNDKSGDQTKAGANSEKQQQSGRENLQQTGQEKSGQDNRGQNSDGDKSSDPSLRQGSEQQGKGSEQQSKSGDRQKDSMTKGKSDSGEKSSANDKSGADEKSGADGKADNKQGDSKDSDSKSGPPKQDQGKSSQAKANQKDKQDTPPDSSGAKSGQEQSGSPGDKTNEGKPSEGGKSQDKPDGKQDGKSSKDDQDQQGKSSPDSSSDQGKSGAGQAGRENKGSPSPQGANQSKPKSDDGQGAESEDKPPSDVQSPTISNKQSNKQGSDDGDRSGGGKQGGGQKANRSGTGEAGQNTAADEGTGRSDEAGKGEASKQAGGNQKSNEKTGQGGDKAGAGSNTRPGGDKAGQTQPGASNDPNAASSEQPGGATGERAGGNQPTTSNPAGSKMPTGGTSDSDPGDWKPADAQPDPANLDYSREATDLALQHLKDELKKDNPDPELLKKLGWTKKDLEQFVRRWEQLRQAAKQPGEKGQQAQREWDESLKSLGLRPKATAIKGNMASDDQNKAMRETRRTSPPPEYSEQFKSYLQGTARGGK